MDRQQTLNSVARESVARVSAPRGSLDLAKFASGLACLWTDNEFVKPQNSFDQLLEKNKTHGGDMLERATKEHGKGKQVLQA